MSETPSKPVTNSASASTSWNSPSGLDLNPRPPQMVRISRRTSLALVALAVVLSSLFAYGGWKRRERQAAALADASLPKRVAPASAVAADIEKDVPAGNVLTVRTPQMNPHVTAPGQIQAPEDIAGSAQSPLGTRDPAPAVVYVRQATPMQPAYLMPQPQQIHQPTLDEQRSQVAYNAEQRAMEAPTSLRGGFGSYNSNPTIPPASVGNDQLAALHSLSPTQSAGSSPVQKPADSNGAFVANARSGSRGDYVASARTAPISPYEIEAGWEIPAVMEQALNSDLPGEVKALVTSNVYDTATGRYVLIPQGARLVGEYNSHLGCGQDGVQVVWNRVIYPDGSSIDLHGMIGEDEHGFSGFRDKVDRHYKRLVRFAVLTSLFAATSEVSQNQNRSVLTYPSPAEVLDARQE